MNGTLRVFYIKQFPLTSARCTRFPPLHATVRCPFPGVIVEILHLLAADIGLRIVPMIAEDFAEFKDKDINEYVGEKLYELMESGAVDLIGFAAQRTAERLERFDFTDRLYYVAFHQLNQLFHLFSCSSFILGTIIHQPHDPANSMEAVIHHLESKQFHLIAYNADFLPQLVKTSQAFPYPQLKAALGENPMRVVDTAEAALQAVMHENALLFQITDDSSAYLARSYCGLTSMDVDMPILESFFMFRKHSPFVPRFNRAIAANRHKINRIIQKYMDYLERYDCAKAKLPQPLRIAPYAGLLFVCSFLVVVALAAFFGELAVWKTTRTGCCPSMVCFPNDKTEAYWPQRYS
ncbi:hypothetical protein M3Y99_01083200 [Aphelenchoides fujianensis]|nr:hypothetical protein M3Y99_01083200 [Aphelenchoides fujianensis]